MQTVSLYQNRNIVVTISICHGNFKLYLSFSFSPFLYFLLQFPTATGVVVEDHASTAFCMQLIVEGWIKGAATHTLQE